MNKYTGLGLSKALADNNCNLESDSMWSQETNGNWGIWKKIGNLGTGQYYAYDILNDICVKYAKEFFKMPWISLHTRYILFLMQEDKINKAEKYIWKHCIFNPKNK